MLWSEGVTLLLCRHSQHAQKTVIGWGGVSSARRTHARNYALVPTELRVALNNDVLTRLSHAAPSCEAPGAKRAAAILTFHRRSSKYFHIGAALCGRVTRNVGTDREANILSS